MLSYHFVIIFDKQIQFVILKKLFWAISHSISTISVSDFLHFNAIRLIVISPLHALSACNISLYFLANIRVVYTYCQSYNATIPPILGKTYIQICFLKEIIILNMKEKVEEEDKNLLLLFFFDIFFNNIFVLLIWW